MHKWFGLIAAIPVLVIAARQSAVDGVLAGNFRWKTDKALIQAEDRDGDSYHAIKDPSIVRYGGRWHMFSTLRGKRRSHQIEYMSFSDWRDTAKGKRQTMRLTDGFFCAPEVFYFAPHKKWYLIYQIVDKSRKPELQPAFSTTTDIANPDSWTPPQLLFSEPTKDVKGWLDFWVISDEKQSHLFFTDLKGHMLRSDAALADFPHGWSEPKVALEGDIYEASHTYRLKGANKYMTFIEAQGPGGKRYFKSYLADRLDGAWSPSAASFDHAFASPGNVRFLGERWTDSFSHGELLRDGYDQTLTVDPNKLTLLIQGVTDQDRQGKPYGQIPWRLGLLEMDR